MGGCGDHSARERATCHRARGLILRRIGYWLSGPSCIGPPARAAGAGRLAGLLLTCGRARACLDRVLVASGGAGGALGSAVMMLTGGIDAADGKNRLLGGLALATGAGSAAARPQAADPWPRLPRPTGGADGHAAICRFTLPS